VHTITITTTIAITITTTVTITISDRYSKSIPFSQPDTDSCLGESQDTKRDLEEDAE
jgi:hypothetical protein